MKRVLALVFVFLMLSSIFMFSSNNFSVAKNANNSWQVMSDRGSCTILSKNGTIELTTVPAYSNQESSVCYFKSYSPTNTFTITCKVKSLNSANPGYSCNFAIQIKSTAPYADPFDSVVFQYGYGGHPGFENFQYARYTYGWVYDRFGSEVIDGTWVTMKMTVYKEPFQVKEEAFSESGQLLGSYTVIDMTTVTFDNIGYIILCAWGSGAGTDYQVKDIAINTINSHKG